MEKYIYEVTVLGESEENAQLVIDTCIKGSERIVKLDKKSG